MKIIKGSLLINTGSCDILTLETNILEGIWPFKNNMKLKTEIACGNGKEYIRKHFKGIEIKIIDLKNKKHEGR